jgi:hypothetical protein
MKTFEKEFIDIYNLFNIEKQIIIKNLIDSLLDLSIYDELTQIELISKADTVFDITLNKISKTFMWKDCVISDIKQLIANLEWDKSDSSRYQTGC